MVRILVFLSLGYLLFNIPLFGDIAKLFLRLFQLVGIIIWKTIVAAIENKPEDRESVLLMCFFFLMMVGYYKSRKV